MVSSYESSFVSHLMALWKMSLLLLMLNYEFFVWKLICIYFYVHPKKRTASTHLWPLVISVNWLYLAVIYLFKVNNGNLRKMCEISSKLVINTPERGQWRHLGVFIVNIEEISNIDAVFPVDVKQVNDGRVVRREFL